MLKGEQGLRGVGRSKLHYVFQAAIFLTAVACIGLRVPVNSATAQLSEAPAGTTTSQANAEIATPAASANAEMSLEDMAAQRLTYVSDQAYFFAAMDLEKVKQFKWGKRLVAIGDNALAGDFTTRLSTATSVTWQVFQWTDGSSSAGIVIRGADPYEEKDGTKPRKFTHRGVECLDFDGKCTYRPDPSTVVFGSTRSALKLMLDAGVAGPQLSQWHRDAQAQMAAPVFAAVSQLATEQDFDELKLSPFEKLVANTKFVTLGLDFDADGIKTNLTCNVKQGEAKTQQQQLAKAMERILLSQVEPEANLTLDQRSERASLSRVMMVYNYLLGDAKVTLLDDKIHFVATRPVTDEMLEGLVNQLSGNANHARSSENLKQLAMAMTVYENQYRYFPGVANLARDSDFEHSWRIVLLPFLGEEELYERYRLEEAWDSPHNQKVTAEMPDIYRSPFQPADATTSGYYIVNGKGTLFDGSSKGFKDVKDGISNTLLFVEAKRDTHWAKPEDIPFVKGDMKRRLTSFDGVSMIFARVDGSVSVAPLESFSAQMLDWLILSSDGHEVDIAIPPGGPNSRKAATVVPAGKN